MSNDTEPTTEQRVLKTMKDILTRVARETATPAGGRRILSLETIHQIRDCLSVISTREMELGGAGEVSSSRPVYPDQRDSVSEVRVSLDSITQTGSDTDKH